MTEPYKYQPPVEKLPECEWSKPMPDKYDFKKAVIGFIAIGSLGMLSDFLGRFDKPVPVNLPMPVDIYEKDELLKLTYIALLENVRDKIDEEILFTQDDDGEADHIHKTDVSL